jgi:hypothetical protein
LLKDYENPKELADMRQKAEKLSFEKILGQHSLNNTTKYAIVNPVVLQQKFEDQYKKMPLSQLIQKHPFSTIEKHHLASKEFLRKLLGKELETLDVRNLQKGFLQECCREEILSRDLLQKFETLSEKAQAESLRQTQKNTEIDQKYSQRQERLLQNLALEEQKAVQTANEIKTRVIRNGSAATNTQANTQTTFDLFTTNKAPETLVFDNLQRRVEGLSVISNTAEQTAKDFLQSKLREIRANRKMIVEQNIGKADQIQYNREIALAKEVYETELRYLQLCFNQTILLV